MPSTALASAASCWPSGLGELQTKSQLAIAANASSIHVIQRDMNRAIWNIATAIDHLAEFAQPSQDTVKVIERLML
ncbi:hypothetical protein, partial [Pseudomonas aeruginosa]|uniref:hypothetical protein n=1 Tax=Pseudomonas aeruginosa TaxID=287 RepID=UPI0037482C27